MGLNSVQRDAYTLLAYHAMHEEPRGTIRRQDANRSLRHWRLRNADRTIDVLIREGLLTVQNDRLAIAEGFDYQRSNSTERMRRKRAREAAETGSQRPRPRLSADSPEAHDGLNGRSLDAHSMLTRGSLAPDRAQNDESVTSPIRADQNRTKRNPEQNKADDDVLLFIEENPRGSKFIHDLGKRLEAGKPLTRKQRAAVENHSHYQYWLS